MVLSEPHSTKSLLRQQSSHKDQIPQSAVYYFPIGIEIYGFDRNVVVSITKVQVVLLFDSGVQEDTLCSLTSRVVAPLPAPTVDIDFSGRLLASPARPALDRRVRVRRRRLRVLAGQPAQRHHRGRHDRPGDGARDRRLQRLRVLRRRRPALGRHQRRRAGRRHRRRGRDGPRDLQRQHRADPATPTRRSARQLQELLRHEGRRQRRAGRHRRLRRLDHQPRRSRSTSDGHADRAGGFTPRASTSRSRRSPIQVGPDPAGPAPAPTVTLDFAATTFRASGRSR